MAETTADVRRDIEMTRERMSSTIQELEQKLNVQQVIRDHPWPAIALAAGAGFLLSGTKADVKAAGAAATTVSATKGKASRLGPLLDDLVAKVLTGVNDALQARADELVEELKQAIGAPTGGQRSRVGHPQYASERGPQREPETRGDMRGDEGRTQRETYVGAVAGVPPRTSETQGTDQWSPSEADRDRNVSGGAYGGESGNVYPPRAD